MKNKIFGLMSLSIFALLLFVGAVSAIILSEWSLTANVQATNVDSNIDVTDLTKSSGVSNIAFDTDGAYVTGWDITATSPKSDEYFQITVSPKTGYEFTLSEINFNHSNSGTGPTDFTLQYSTNSDFSSPTDIVTDEPITTMSTLSSNSALNIVVDEGETLYFRWFAYNASNESTGRFYLIDLDLDGTVERVPSFCKNGPIDDSDLRLKVDITNRGEGKDDEWLPLDTIEIEVELENDKDLDGDGDLDNVFFELGLFKKGSSTNIIDDMIWISDDDEEVEVGDVDEGDDEIHTFEFRIDPREVENGNDYILMIKAYPEDEEDETCIDYSDDLSSSKFGSSQFSADIEINKESDKEKMVIIDTKTLPLPLDAFCGQEVIFSADVYNIGDRDFEDQIMVSLENKELGIDLEEVILGDLDEGERTKVRFSFEVPSDAEEKTYLVYMRTFYDYDEDDDEYDERSDDLFPVQLKVEGGCVFDPELTVTSSLEAGGTAGEELIIKGTIKNTASETRSFTIGARNYATWAELVSVDPDSFTLKAGESKEVLFTFLVNEDVSGSGDFDIELLTDDEVISQPVSVLIEEQVGGVGFPKITGIAISGENRILWIIGFLNVILVVAIIFVAVRVARKSRSS